MISEVATAFPLCLGLFFGKDPIKSTGRKRICNPLRNLSANPPRALKCLRFLRLARKPENVFPTLFPRFTFRACSVLATPMYNTRHRLLNTKESE